MSCSDPAMYYGTPAQAPEPELPKEATIDPLPHAPNEGSADTVVKKLVAYRKQHGVSAAYVLGMALEIGYRAGQRKANADAFSAGYDAGIQAVIDAADAAEPVAQPEPVGEQS